MMSSSVMNPVSLFFSKTGSCLIPLWIISLAVLPRENSGETFGAGRVRVLILVVAGSRFDLVAHLWVMTPSYLPLLFVTARTGGISFLKMSKDLDRESVSSMVEKPFEQMSFTVA